MKAQQTRGGNSGTSRAASVEQSASAPTKAARSNSDAQERLRSRSSGLQNGSEGRDVKSLQDELQWGGYLSGEDKNTGWGTFGPKTEAAVRALQAAEGLEVTGVVDAATRKALRSSVAAHNSEAALPAPLAEGDEGGSVRRVQKALVKLGFLSQAAYERHPGSYSGQTARGVKRLQADAGLTESGSLDAETWQALIDRAGREVTGQDPEKGRVVTGDPQMKEGSEGASVKELERLLEDYGAELSPDRVYDKDTTKAVKAFQKANNLVSDGRVGVATAAALVSGRATSVGAADPSVELSSGSGPEWLVQFLVAQGLEGALLRTVWAIGMRESYATPSNTTHGGTEAWSNSGPTYYDVGLFQINNRNLSTVQELYGADADMSLMLDPVKNYAVAKHMSSDWQNFLPWGLNPDGTFNWAYYSEEWLAQYQESSEAEFEKYFQQFTAYANDAGIQV